jgi:DNA polymerase III epsilon subunit-like protein
MKFNLPQVNFMVFFFGHDRSANFNKSMTRIAVIDFETTGLSPAMGDRATEVAIVLSNTARSSTGSKAS